MQKIGQDISGVSAWLTGWLDCLACWLAAWMAWLAGWFGWLPGWLASWLADWLAGWRRNPSEKKCGRFAADIYAKDLARYFGCICLADWLAR
jgi:hypothetical protein